jgi:hypothetical protein
MRGGSCPIPPKAALIVEPSAGGDAAFDGIVRRYYERILKFCTYTLGGNQSLAEPSVEWAARYAFRFCFTGLKKMQLFHLFPSKYIWLI